MKKIISLAIGLIILILIGFGAFYFWLTSSMNSKQTHAKANQFIVIPKGSTPNEIVEKLSNEGIISNASAMKNYIRFFYDANKLKAGEYQFESPISPNEVLKELEKGEERTIKLTIPEGWTRYEISKRIAERFPTNPPMDDKAVLTLMDDVSLIKDIDPNAKNLEGYLYPTTYSFPKDAKPQDVIKRMVEQFRKTWKPEWTSKAQTMGKSVQQIMTIASLIENESKFDEERQIVSSVIYNRLSKGMALGIDATNVYIAKMLGRWDGTIHKSDLEVDSPYNTRKVVGLPPGPISSASESAIEAALNPQKTDYIFYVLNVDKNDGSHHFYASAAEFEKGKAAYQKWLAEQRGK
ncbi:MAG: endolytic transglycosylase MltG [Pyrinomonadaceae bacterium]|jgi:UPF0755 protein|nr:endolytic transglycosylase MltG [Pyrinomonadaceae bacterium]